MNVGKLLCKISAMSQRNTNSQIYRILNTSWVYIICNNMWYALHFSWFQVHFPIQLHVELKP